MKNNIIITIFLLFAANILAQQSSSIDFFEDNGFDKVSISHYNLRDKTFYPPTPPKLIPVDSLESSPLVKSPTEEIVRESHIMTGMAELTKNEQRKLIKKLRRKLIPIYAMDNNRNIKIDFYRNDTVFQNITISPNTKNLIVHKNGCSKSKDNEGNEYDPCVYRGQMTPELERYVNYLLKKKNILN